MQKTKLNKTTILGGNGTYNGWESRSRDSNYKANYGFHILPPNLQYVCSGYSIKLWNAYRNGSGVYLNSALPYPTGVTVPHWSPDTIYRQL